VPSSIAHHSSGVLMSQIVVRTSLPSGPNDWISLSFVVHRNVAP
jgi:hypothetical protein